MEKNNHKNNFDFLRISAALSVLYSHHFALTGQVEPSFLGFTSLGGGAVIIFFVISGYLTAGSLFNDSNAFRFLLKRFLRIWPGLFFVILISIFLIGPVATKLNLKEYFSSPVLLWYAKNILLKINYVLPGVFENNPYPNAVNGSLWSIPLEVKCYLILAFLGFIGVAKNKWIFLFFIFSYIFWFFSKNGVDFGGEFDLNRQMIAYFFSGVALAILRPYWEKHSWWVIFFMTLLTVILIKIQWIFTAAFLALPFLIVFFGCKGMPILIGFGKFGDPSYGIYLYAFPIQQLMIFYFYENYGFVGTLIFSVIITVFVAYASWHIIEKNAIKLKPKKNYNDK